MTQIDKEAVAAKREAKKAIQYPRAVAVVEKVVESKKTKKRGKR